MASTNPRAVAVSRRRDLLLAAVMVGILLTPAWLAPWWIALPWELVVLVLGAAALVRTWQHAPWVPTPASELPRILAALQLAPGQAFCDLGAGDGRLVGWVHEATGARCVGIEASPLLAGLAWLRLARHRDARVRLGNLYDADLTGFDVLYVWGTAYSVGTPAFRAFAERALKPGARLVSYHTAMEGWEPVAVDQGGIRPLYTYVRPAG